MITNWKHFCFIALELRISIEYIVPSSVGQYFELPSALITTFQFLYVRPRLTVTRNAKRTYIEKQALIPVIFNQKRSISFPEWDKRPQKSP